MNQIGLPTPIAYATSSSSAAVKGRTAAMAETPQIE